jgi:tetratricopeptide (TPR) repeat protein
MSKVARKDPCPCGSGKRYKHCCGKTAPAKAPAGPEAHAVFLRGFKAHCAGRLDEAAAAYRGALELNPDHPDALHFFGMILGDRGDLPRAYAMVRRSLELKGNDADYWANAATLAQRLGKPEEAVAAYRKSLRLVPDHAERHMHLGSLLLFMQQAAAAADELKLVLKLNPAMGQAWFLLGNALIQLPSPDVEGALAAYRNAYSRMPRNAELNISLSTALMVAHQPEEALKVLLEAVDLDPRNAAVWSNLGKLWMEREEAGKSIECYEKSVSLTPQAVEPRVALGVAYKNIGNFTQALRCFDEVLKLQPGNTAALVQQLEIRRFEDANDPVIAWAISAVSAPGDPGKDKAAICFSLGKVLDRLGKYDEAFRYFEKGNEFSANKLFDREAYRSSVDRVIARYTREFMDGLSAAASPSAQPIFIVGMPRSGTSLTEQILSSHPEVAGGGERGFWTYAENKVESGEWRLDPAGMREIASRALEDIGTVAGAAGRRHVTDKMPDNFKRLGLIHSIFPNARFIHVRRHPIDNCLSIFFQDFVGHEYRHRLADLAFYYQEYRRLMAHWRTVIPEDRLLEFDYEELVANQEQVTRRLLEFCGLEWDPACLNFQENRRVVKTASIMQVRQKMYSSSVDRWRNYEAYVGDLMPLLDLP